MQLLLLDTRYFRDGLERGKRGAVTGPYRPTKDTRKTLLGEAQWAWLETQLRRPAELRLIASSIQVVSRENGWETWGNFPHERQRLFDLVKTTGANGVLILSGDRHMSELSCERGEAVPYPMYDITCSGLSKAGGGRDGEPNPHRVFGPLPRHELRLVADRLGREAGDGGYPDPRHWQKER